MAFEIKWTERAIKGFDEVIEYLNTHWTEKEVANFIQDTKEFLETLNLLQRTSRHKNLHRGPLNKLTIITYRVKARKNQIEIINIRDGRRKPK